ncbi:hypothetical protein CBS12448_1456 [Aspergillus niger]|nr:hypothetical protein CBS12448_1456 [Aspergillus niger]KAI3053174.1 hypothetical protein CBS147352_4462 [Aspergillus niger]
MSPPSSLRGGHQMARLRVPQSSPSSSSSLPPSGQKDPARPSVRSAPSVPTMVSTSSRSGVPAPTAPKYLRTSKYLSTPSFCGSSDHVLSFFYSPRFLSFPCGSGHVHSLFLFPFPGCVVPEKATSTRSSIPTPAPRSPVAPRTTSSPSVAQATSIPSPPSLSPGASFLKRFDEKHPSTRLPVAPRTTSIPSPVAPRTTSTPSGNSRPSRLQALREAYYRSREARARSDAALASTKDGAAPAAKSAARKGKSVKSVQFSEVTTVVTVRARDDIERHPRMIEPATDSPSSIRTG